MAYIDAKFAVIAHRGGCLEVPENTLYAFEHAAKLHPGIVFETDVHCTRDGEIVVMHDSKVDRTTNGHGYIKDMTLFHLERFDAAYNFTQDRGKHFPLRGKKIKIPRLVDLLNTFPNRISIDLKTPGYEGKVIDIIRRAQAEDRVVLASFNYISLYRVRKRAPDFITGFSRQEILATLVCDKCNFRRLRPSRGNVYQVPVKSDMGVQILTQNFINEAHKLHKPVHVWTINDEASMRQLISQGVDGIITDAPSLLTRVAKDCSLI